jgi:hypothetical protein
MNHAAALSPAVSRPAHVPEAAVYDFALQQAFSPKAMLALKEGIRPLANQLPVWTPW